MVKLFQMLQGHAEYFGLILIKSNGPQNWLQIISNGQIMLCRKNSVIFQSNALCTCTLRTCWGLGTTPKTPSGQIQIVECNTK